jgi:hypothetical protein
MVAGTRDKKPAKWRVSPQLAMALMLASTVAFADPGAATVKGVQPIDKPGNFVSETDDNQVCYDMSALGYIGAVTSDMRGFKIDPPVAYSDGYVSTTISGDGKYLDWMSTGANVPV